MQTLGYIIEQGDLRPDPAKVNFFEEWPEPTDRRQFQRFLGFANFYHWFIRDVSKIGSPVTCLTSPKVSFQWDQAAQKSFIHLKERFTSARIISCQGDHLYPRMKHFFLEWRGLFLHDSAPINRAKVLTE